jgi:predicted amidohydrolase
VLFPEYLHFRGGDDGFRASARPVPGPYTDAFAEVARRHGVWILAGSVAESSGEGARPYNTSTLIAPDGSIAARYRKIHLFDVAVDDGPVDNESARVAPGHESVVVDVDGIRTGLSVCYDLRFPELYRTLALQGAEVLAVPSNFTERTGRDHWEVLLRARAIENGAWVLAPGQSGGPPGQPAYGRSMIIDPVGDRGRTSVRRGRDHPRGGGDGPRRRGPSSDPVSRQPAAERLPPGLGASPSREAATNHFTSWTPIAPEPWTEPAPTGPDVMYRTNHPARQLELPLPRIGTRLVPLPWHAELWPLFWSDM